MTAATSSGGNGVLNNNYNFMKLFAFIHVVIVAVMAAVVGFIARNKIYGSKRRRRRSRVREGVGAEGGASAD